MEASKLIPVDLKPTSDFERLRIFLVLMSAKREQKVPENTMVLFLSIVSFSFLILMGSFL